MANVGRASAILALLPWLAGCHSFEDYVYPAPAVEVAPAEVRHAPAEVVLDYDAAFDPLPVVGARIADRPVRALIATRRGRHSIAPGALPEDALVEGETTVPVLVEGKLEPAVRTVTRVDVELGEALLLGLPVVVEPLPEGIDLALSPGALIDGVVTLDGPGRALRLRRGRLPAPEEKGGGTVRLELELLFGSASAGVSRFWASISAVAASELDGRLLVGRSDSTALDKARGPEHLPPGPAALEPLIVGEREVRMDGVFGRDGERATAQVVERLGSGWLVLGAGYLAQHVLELDPANRLARLR